ncbi:hypothetical protein G3N95_23885 [Paraburkholderia sp. Tr-20389]|uniref:hypothetical protein n=1 Tax=Paraburkholderia sp. Tr-20389 TaxID=2703903 RepID=UPI00198015F9|nr:hypothetical protein [Paraburkholderia sp. Tr-20389]MBN3756005.1 hypothetical protein [Paraburkholderia sp. Tr-20389]
MLINFDDADQNELQKERKTTSTPAQPNRDLNQQINRARSSEDDQKVESNPVSNWAWTTAHLDYDWMDSNVPFAGLD